MKKLSSLSSIFLLLAFLLTACGGADNSQSSSSSSDPVSLRFAIWDKNQAPALQHWRISVGRR